MRLDLPSVLQDGRVAPEHYAELLAGYLAQDTAATDCLIFVFKERVHPEPAGAASEVDPISGPDKDLVEALQVVLERQDLPLREAWLVDCGHLWHVDCPDPDACLSLIHI